MKYETKRKKQLENIRHWLSLERQTNFGVNNMNYLLIAVEQIFKYLEMKEND